MTNKKGKGGRAMRDLPPMLRMDGAPDTVAYKRRVRMPKML